MAKEYFRWIGAPSRPDNVIVIEDNDAYVFNVPNQAWKKDNYYLKAKWDPGSDFEQITKEEAEKILEVIKKVPGSSS